MHVLTNSPTVPSEGCLDIHSLCACVLSPFSRVSLPRCGLQPARLLCPWDSPGKNTGVGCHALLQRLFPTQGLNQRLLCLLHCRATKEVYS